MSKVNLKVKEEDYEKADQFGADFVLPPPGYYILTLSQINPGFSKNNDGSHDENRPRLECIWAITGVGTDDVEPTENYGNVWDYVSFSEESGPSRARFLRALGHSGTSVDIEMDANKPDTVIGTKVLARLKHGKPGTAPDGTKYDPKARIASLLPYSERNTAEGGEDAFGAADDNGYVGGTSDGDMPEDYSEAELMEMDLKALGKVAQEDFDLDPTQFIVKARGKVNNDKTQAALVAAILEAQSAEEGSGAENGDDSPF